MLREHRCIISDNRRPEIVRHGPPPFSTRCPGQISRSRRYSVWRPTKTRSLANADTPFIHTRSSGVLLFRNDFICHLYVARNERASIRALRGHLAEARLSLGWRHAIKASAAEGAIILRAAKAFTASSQPIIMTARTPKFHRTIVMKLQSEIDMKIKR